jgi:predicted transcriptional regulator
MKRSKLEMYIDILKVLTQSGPLKLSQLMNKSNFNGKMFKEYLDFLIRQDFVEELTANKNTQIFIVTQRGKFVLNYFLKPSQEISVMEES